MVYLAASVPLREIPWEGAGPPFHVRPLRDSERVVRTATTLPHAYYVGAHEKCGCPFAVGPADELTSEEEAAAGLAARNNLRGYLESERERLRRPIRFEITAWPDGVQGSVSEPWADGTTAELPIRPDWFHNGSRLVL